MSTNGRDEHGRFPKGASGNPAGYSKRFVKLKQLAQSHTEEAIEGLLDLARNARTEAVRLGAWREILDRGFGKPAQELLVDRELITKKLTDLSNAELMALSARLEAMEKVEEQFENEQQPDRPH